MTITHYSTEDFRAALLNDSAPGLIPLSPAAKLLKVSRNTVITTAKDSNKLHLVTIDCDGILAQGITLDSLKAELKRKYDRASKLKAATFEAVGAHINNFLACHGLISMEYSKDVMAPFDLNHHIGHDRQHIGQILGELSAASYENDGFLLSTIVVYKTGREKGEPAGGYWQMVESVTGQVFAENDRKGRAQFVKEQREKIEQYAKKLVHRG